MHSSPKQIYVRKSRRHIGSHTGLRGVASLLVVAYHLQFGYEPKLWIETASGFFTNGYLFVDLFFILSGFVIGYSSYLDGNYKISEAKKFYVSRFARIYPLHLFCLIYVFISLYTISELKVVNDGGFVTKPQHLESLALELMLLQSWIPNSPYWNVPSWSISAESFAYLLFPCIAYLRMSKPKALATALLIIPISFYFYVGVKGRSLDIIAGLAPFRCLSGFVLGLYICKFRYLSEKLSISIKSCIQVISVSLIISIMIFNYNDLFIIPAFCMLVWSTWEDKGFVANVLSKKTLQYIGKISYSVYLNHAVIVIILGEFWSRVYRYNVLSNQIVRLIEIIFTLSIIIVISDFTFRRVELVWQIRVKRFFGYTRAETHSEPEGDGGRKRDA